MYLYKCEMQMTISKLIDVLKMYIVLEESYNPITKTQDKEFYKKIAQRNETHVSNMWQTQVTYGVLQTCKNVIFLGNVLRQRNTNIREVSRTWINFRFLVQEILHNAIQNIWYVQ